MVSCNGQKKIELIENNGLLTQYQSFSKMYFKNTNEGYLFGELQDWPNMSDKDLENPLFTPQPNYFSIIYKTKDGGKSWELIDSIAHREFMDYYTVMNNNIYIGQSDFYGKKYYLSKFNLLNDSLTSIQNIGYLGPISNNRKNIIYCSNYDYLKFCNENLDIVDSLKIDEIGVELLQVKDKIFSTVLTPQDNYQFYQLFEIKNQKKENKNISFSVKIMLKYDDENLLLVGNREKEVVVAKYNIKTNKEDILKEFNGYRMVKEVQYNGKIITGLMGGISGMFVDYVLFYSTDKGKTWQISNLKERSYVHPTFLIDNILYIYSGGGRIQKIEF